MNKIQVPYFENNNLTPSPHVVILGARIHYATFNSFENSWLCKHPRRTCEALFEATMQNNPMKDNPIPKEINLQELQTWILPLIEEEKK